MRTDKRRPRDSPLPRGVVCILKARRCLFVTVTYWHRRAECMNAAIYEGDSPMRSARRPNETDPAHCPSPLGYPIINRHCDE